MKFRKTLKILLGKDGGLYIKGEAHNTHVPSFYFFPFLFVCCLLHFPFIFNRNFSFLFFVFVYLFSVNFFFLSSFLIQSKMHCGYMNLQCCVKQVHKLRNRTSSPSNLRTRSPQVQSGFAWLAWHCAPAVCYSKPGFATVTAVLFFLF